MSVFASSIFVNNLGLHCGRVNALPRNPSSSSAHPRMALTRSM